jgi:hypothetical protein
MSVKRYATVVVAAVCALLAVAPVAGAKPIFHKVPFSVLIPNHPSGTYTTTTTSFPYILSRKGIKPGLEGEAARPVTLFTAKQGDYCASAHVEFLFGQSAPGGATYPYLTETSGTLSIVRPGPGPVTQTRSFESRGSLNAKLAAGMEWSIIATATKPAGNPIGSFEVFINGWAMCERSDAVR